MTDCELTPEERFQEIAAFHPAGIKTLSQELEEVNA